MKLAVIPSTLSQDGIEAQTTFGIEPTAEAFRILSSGLYSDKISAVLREVGCNAADAHVAAGIPELPIEVQLPTVLEPTLRIRDFGLGLTEKDLIKRYTKYFASDKKSSNDYTGAYGLGSKSPFSYIDSFTVTAVREGEKRLYVAHVGPQGVPVLSLMGRESAVSDWPHGLGVSFPVKPKDIAEFQGKARAIFRWFSVLPKITGGNAIEPASFVLEGNTFAVSERGGLTKVLWMGNVAYPIDIRSVPGLSTGKVELLSRGLILKAPIGAVRPAASREALEYAPQDRMAIEGLVDRAIEELRERLQALALEEHGTEWETRKRLHTRLHGAAVLTEVGTVTTLFDQAVAEAGLKQKIIGRLSSAGIHAPNTLGHAGDTAAYVYAYHGGANNPVSRSSVVAGTLANQRRCALYLLYAHPAMVVVLDVPGSDQRIRLKFQAQGSAWLKAVVIGVVGPRAGEQAQEISEALGGLEVVRASEWPAPPRAAKRSALTPTKGSEGVRYLRIVREERGARGELNPPGASKDVDLSSLDETGRYYLLAREAQPPHCSEFLNRIDAVRRYLGLYEVQALWKAYEEVRCQGIDLPLIEGCAVLAGARSCRPFDKAGWQDLIVTMRHRLIERKEEICAGFFAVPNLWSKRENAWIGPHGRGMAALLASLDTGSLTWKVCESVVNRRPVFARWVEWFRRLKEASAGGGDETDRRQVLLRNLFLEARRLLGPMHETDFRFSTMIPAQSIELRRYPRLAFIDRAHFNSVLTDPGCADRIPAALAMLEAGLSEEVVS